MKLLNTIIEQAIDYVSTSEFTDKLAGIGGGMAASILTFVNAGFADFAAGPVFPAVRVAVVLRCIFRRSWIAPPLPPQAALPVVGL